MEWTQTLTIIGVNVAVLGLLATLIIQTINKMDTDVKSIATRLDGHATRIDQLYSMFISLLKEKKE